MQILNLIFYSDFFYISSTLKSTVFLPEDRQFYVRLNHATDEFMRNRVVLQSCIMCFWVSFHCLWVYWVTFCCDNPPPSPPTCSSPERGHHHEEGDGADDAHETDTGKGPSQTSKLPYQIQRF
jgi:hypothetical protein